MPYIITHLYSGLVMEIEGGKAEPYKQVLMNEYEEGKQSQLWNCTEDGMIVSVVNNKFAMGFRGEQSFVLILCPVEGPDLKKWKFLLDDTINVAETENVLEVVDKSLAVNSRVTHNRNTGALFQQFRALPV